MRYIFWMLRPQFFIASLFVALLVFGTGFRLTSSRPVLAQASARHAVLHAQTPLPTPPVDCAVSACMALTFDDGPSPSNTAELLDVLKRYKVHATFFLMGKHIAGNEQVIKRMYLEGHEIGNHTWDHPDLTTLLPEQVEAEYDSTERAIAAVGVPAPKLFRPPYGEYNQMVLAHIPLSVIRWDIDPSDYLPSYQPYVVEHVVSHAHPGGIVIMHDTERNTLLSAEPIIQQLQAAGYHLVTVSDLLDLPAGQHGIYFHR